MAGKAIPNESASRRGASPADPARHAAEAPAVASLIVDLVHDIHAAGAADHDWTPVLEGLRTVLDARSVILARHEFVTGQGETLCVSPRDGNLVAAYASFAARDPWFLLGDEYRPGRVLGDDDLFGSRDLQRTDFYRGFLQPHGLLHRLCGVVARRGDEVTFVSVHRGTDAVPFGPGDKAGLRVLLTHLALSMETRWRVRSAADLSDALMRIVDQDGSATLLVDADSDVVYRNPKAVEVLARTASLRLEGARLAATSPTDQRALRQSIDAATSTHDPDSAGASRVITLGAPGGKSPVVLVVRPAGSVCRAESGGRRPVAMITIRGDSAAHDPAACAFAHQFELTPAQSRVCALVFAGQSLSTVARSLGVSDNTVRSHLKQIFQKTGAHGQMELVHLHARMCFNRG